MFTFALMLSTAAAFINASIHKKQSIQWDRLFWILLTELLLTIPITIMEKLV